MIIVLRAARLRNVPDVAADKSFPPTAQVAVKLLIPPNYFHILDSHCLALSAVTVLDRSWSV